MLTVESFVAEIDAFLERSGMSASAFGKASIGDPNLVSDLRAGRSPSLRLIGRVKDYIEAQEKAPESGATAQTVAAQ